MMPEAKPSSPSILKAVITGVVIFGVILFFVVSLNTGDILWFWPVFNQIPVAITLNCYGTQIDINPGQAAFQAVTEAVNSSLSGGKRWDELTLSKATYEEYQTSTDVMILRLQYDPPATIHSANAFYKSENWLVIPLVGRHASGNTIFGLNGEYFATGSYHLNSTAPITNALQSTGICTKH